MATNKNAYAKTNQAVRAPKKGKRDEKNRTTPASARTVSAKTCRFVYWTPRIASLLLVVMFVLLSFDVFTPDATAGEMAVGFVMHNIPTLVLIAFVWLAWRFELVGAIVFGLLSLFFIRQFVMSSGEGAWPINEMLAAIAFTGLMVLASVLYFLDWKRKKA